MYPTLLDPADPDVPLRWMQQVARGWDGVQRFELASLLAEVAGTESPELRVAELPHDPEVRWLGLPLEPDADVPAGRVAGGFHAPDGVDPSRLTGLFVDELIERIPHRDHTAGIVFDYDQPKLRRAPADVAARGAARARARRTLALGGRRRLDRARRSTSPISAPLIPRRSPPSGTSSPRSSSRTTKKPRR